MRASGLLLVVAVSVRIAGTRMLPLMWQQLFSLTTTSNCAQIRHRQLHLVRGNLGRRRVRVKETRAKGKAKESTDGQKEESHGVVLGRNRALGPGLHQHRGKINISVRT